MQEENVQKRTESARAPETAFSPVLRLRGVTPEEEAMLLPTIGATGLDQGVDDALRNRDVFFEGEIPLGFAVDSSTPT